MATQKIQLDQVFGAYPADKVRMHSDFVNDCTPFAASTGSSPAPSSANVTYSAALTTGVYGYATIECTAVQSARGGIFASNGSTTNVERNLQPGNGACDFTAKVKVFNSSASTQRCIVGVGLSHGTVGTTMLQYGAAFVSSGTGNWMAQTADNNVVTEVDTGISCSTAWTTLRIVTDSSWNLIKFYANGSLVRTVTGVTWDYSVPLAWGCEARDKATGGSGTSFSLLVDYMTFEYALAR